MKYLYILLVSIFIISCDNNINEEEGVIDNFVKIKLVASLDNYTDYNMEVSYTDNLVMEEIIVENGYFEHSYTIDNELICNIAHISCILMNKDGTVPMDSTGVKLYSSLYINDELYEEQTDDFITSITVVFE